MGASLGASCHLRKFGHGCGPLDGFRKECGGTVQEFWWGLFSPTHVAVGCGTPTFRRSSAARGTRWLAGCPDPAPGRANHCWSVAPGCWVVGLDEGAHLLLPDQPEPLFNEIPDDPRSRQRPPPRDATSMHGRGPKRPDPEMMFPIRHDESPPHHPLLFRLLPLLRFACGLFPSCLSPQVALVWAVHQSYGRCLLRCRTGVVDAAASRRVTCFCRDTAIVCIPRAKERAPKVKSE